MNANTYIKLLDDIGWFSSMREERRKEKEKRIKEAFLKSEGETKDVFLSLNDVWFDAEGVGEPDGENMTGYPQLLQELSTASDGIFPPLNISEEQNDNDTISISFEIKGKRYEVTVKDPEWYDDEFINTVNVTLEELGAKQRFFDLPTEDQCQAYCFVSKEAYDFALKKKLIPSY